MLAEVIPLAEELIVTTTPRDDHQLDLTIELGPERTEQALARNCSRSLASEVLLLALFDCTLPPT